MCVFASVCTHGYRSNDSDPSQQFSPAHLTRSSRLYRGGRAGISVPILQMTRLRLRGANPPRSCSNISRETRNQVSRLACPGHQEAPGRGEEGRQVAGDLERGLSMMLRVQEQAEGSGPKGFLFPAGAHHWSVTRWLEPACSLPDPCLCQGLLSWENPRSSCLVVVPGIGPC